MKKMKTWLMQLGKTSMVGVVGFVLVLVLALSVGTVYAMGSSYITLEEAQAIALAKVGGGEVLSSWLSNDLFSKEYEFTISYNNAIYELDVAARTGLVNDYEVDTATNVVTTDPATSITLEEAQVIALEKVGGGTVVSSRTSTDDGRTEYEFVITYNDYKYEVDVYADNGAINDFESSRIDTPVNSSAAITSEQAQSNALARVGGGVVVGVEYDRDDGVYEIEIIYGQYDYDVDVSAADGSIVSFDYDLND